MKEKICFDKDWKFFLGDLSPRSDADGWGGAKAKAYSFGAAAENLNDSAWRKLDIPHDFVVEGEYTRKQIEGSDMRKIPEMESIDSRHFAGGSLEGGIGWYRKKFDIPAEYENKRIYIYFDGVYRNSTVYLNEYFVGNHPNGYTGFYYDITDFVNMGGENVLAVRVDASGREGWWYEGGGIYRHVWLEIKDNIYVEPFGVFVETHTDVDSKTAEVKVSTEIASKFLDDKTVTVESLIEDQNGDVISKMHSKEIIDAWGKTICVHNTSLKDICLWDIDNPYLYQMKTNIYLDDEIIDTHITNFGIRDIRFDADTGFYLNGKNIKVKGLCCHHDHAGVGIAVPDAVQEYRIAQMKSMEANAYRCAHHPPTPELLDICDKLGMLVMDETRRMSSADRDLEQLRAMVKRDRNHPSIFIWGIGNEEIFSQDRPETVRATITMKAELKKLDNTRPITSAVVCWNGKERFENAKMYLPVTKHLDVMGFNYCRTAWDDYHERRPQQPMIITEASSNSGTRGCYSTNEDIGQYYILDNDNLEKCASKNKAVKKDIAETEWKYCAERRYISGIFLWTGMDYRGEPTPLSYPAISSQFGIFDYCGFPKDNFYYYKSWWSDEPVLHVFPHWNFPGREGEKLDVHCYSNLDEIEIFVNGRSYGRKVMQKNWYLSWENVVYEPGELMAKGYKDGVEIIVKKVKTTDCPYKIKMEAYKNEIMKNSDIAIINVRIVDKDGSIVPTADNEIYFKVEGAGGFLGVGNGNPGSHESDKLPVRRAFNGMCQLLVKSLEMEGKIKITALSNNIIGDEITIEVK